GTPADEADEGPVAAGPLGDGYGKQRFGAFADLGPFGHVAEAVEIDVGPRVDGDQRAFGSSAGFHFAAQTRQRQGAGRLGDGAVIVEDVLDGGADLVGGDGD